MSSCLCTKNNRTLVVLEFCDGPNAVDITLAVVPRFPNEYKHNLPHWITSVSITTRVFGPHTLNLVWEEFSLLSKQTGETIELPRDIRLNRFQSFRLQRVLKAGEYLVNVKLVQAGRVVYFQNDGFDN
jgi:hypothetical protein